MVESWHWLDDHVVVFLYFSSRSVFHTPALFVFIALITLPCLVCVCKMICRLCENKDECVFYFGFLLSVLCVILRVTVSAGLAEGMWELFIYGANKEWSVFA